LFFALTDAGKYAALASFFFFGLAAGTRFGAFLLAPVEPPAASSLARSQSFELQLGHSHNKLSLCVVHWPTFPNKSFSFDQQVEQIDCWQLLFRHTTC
jgi:hypothetical protein